VPIEAPGLVTRILREIVPVYLADNTRARIMDAEGSFHLIHPAPGEPPVRCQTSFLEEKGDRTAGGDLPGMKDPSADGEDSTRRPKRSSRR